MTKYVYQVSGPTDSYFTDKADQATLAKSNGYKVSRYLAESNLGKEVYQERRYQCAGKNQIEYWADVEKGVYQYIHPTQRRIIYVLGE